MFKGRKMINNFVRKIIKMNIEKLYNVTMLLIMCFQICLSFTSVKMQDRKGKGANILWVTDIA